MTSKLERAVARGQAGAALDILSELLDADPGNTGFIEIRALLQNGDARAA